MANSFVAGMFAALAASASAATCEVRMLPAWKASRGENGEIVVEGVASGEGSIVEVRAYDLCATRPAIVVCRPVSQDRRFRVELPAPTGDVASDPAWICVRGGDEIHSISAKWSWPDVPDFGGSRLNLSRLTGDNFGRLEYGNLRKPLGRTYGKNSEQSIRSVHESCKMLN